MNSAASRARAIAYAAGASSILAAITWGAQQEASPRSTYNVRPLTTGVGSETEELCCAIDALNSEADQGSRVAALCLYDMKKATNADGSPKNFCAQTNRMNDPTKGRVAPEAETFAGKNCAAGQMTINPTLLAAGQKPALATILRHEAFHALYDRYPPFSGGGWAGPAKPALVHWYIYQSDWERAEAGKNNTPPTVPDALRLDTCLRAFQFCVPQIPALLSMQPLDSRFQHSSSTTLGSANGLTYEVSPASSVVHVKSSPYQDLTVFDCGIRYPLDLRLVERLGARTLLVAGLDEDRTTGVVAAFVASDADGLYNDARGTPVLADAQGLDAIAAVAYDTDHDRLFVFDARSNEIYVGHGLVDVELSVFATPMTVPTLASARKMLWLPEENTLRLVESNDDDDGFHCRVTLLHDTDADDDLDSSEVLESWQAIEISPALLGGVMDGSDTAYYTASYGAEVELWALDSQMQETSLLGVSTMARRR